MVRIWIALIFGFVLCVSNSALALTALPLCYVENDFYEVTPKLDCVRTSFQRDSFGCHFAEGPGVVVENGCDSELSIMLDASAEPVEELSISEQGYQLGVGETVVVVARGLSETHVWESGDYSWTYPMEMDGVDYELRIGFSLPPRETSVELGGCRQIGASSTVLWFLCLFGLFIHRPAFCDRSLTNEQG